MNKYDGYKIEIFNTNKNDPHSLSNNTVRSLAEDQAGRIWIGTDDGLNVYDPQSELIYQININSEEIRFPVWSLNIQDGYILAGSTNGLWRAKIQNAGIQEIESGFQPITDFSYNQNKSKLIRSIVQSKHGDCG